MIRLEDAMQLDDVLMIHGPKQGDLVSQAALSLLFLGEVRLEDHFGRKDLLILNPAYLIDTSSAAFSDLPHHLIDMLKAHLINQLPELPHPNFDEILEGDDNICALLLRVDNPKSLQRAGLIQSSLLKYSLKLDFLIQHQQVCVLQLLVLGGGQQEEVILENNFILFLRGVFQEEKGGEVKRRGVDWQELREINDWKEFCGCFWL